MAVRKRIVVSGRVQGVFYRDTCRREAERLGIVGSARNLDDGRVEVIAEGEESVVQQLIDWCRNGPSYADVDSVDVTAESPTGETGFRTL
ncbi:MAG: acylphosphatase [Actinomycetota bacterium]|nr:acylphosphatase [Actinomycetota bacterium]